MSLLRALMTLFFCTAILVATTAAALADPDAAVQLQGQTPKEDQLPPQKPAVPLQGSIQLQDNPAPPAPGPDFNGSAQDSQDEGGITGAAPSQPKWGSGQARLGQAIMRLFLANPTLVIRINGRYIDPSLYGICGVTVTVRPNGYPVVLSVFNGTGAYEAGIHRGDLITAVEGVPTYGFSHKEIWNHLTGKPGSHVMLTLARDGEQYTTDVVRTDIKNISAFSTRQLFMSQYRMMGRSPFSEP